MQQPSKNCRQPTHKFSKRLSQIAHRLRQSKCKSSEARATNEGEAETSPRALDTPNRQAGTDVSSKIHQAVNAVTPSDEKHEFFDQKNNQEIRSGNTGFQGDPETTSKAGLTIGEPRLNSGSLLIGEYSSILNRTSSFRRSEYRAAPKPQGLRKSTALSATPRDLPPSIEDPEQNYIKVSPNIAATSSALSRPQSPPLDLQLVLTHRDNRVKGRRSSDATLTGLLEKFDEIRARCRDPMRPLPQIPKRSSLREKSPPTVPEVTHQKDSQSKYDPFGLRLGDLGASLGDLAENLTEASNNPFSGLSETPLESVTTADETVDTYADDQFVFEEYSGSSTIPLWYRDSHKSVKFLDSQLPALPPGGGYVITPSNSTKEHQEYKSEIAQRSPSIKRPISKWRAGHMLLQTDRTKPGSHQDIHGTAGAQGDQFITINDGGNRDATMEHDSELHRISVASTLRTENRVQSRIKITGLPRILPIRQNTT